MTDVKPQQVGWQAGWWQGAQHVASPNFGARPAAVEISLAVIHSISLPPGEYGGDAIERLFTNRLDWDAHPYFQSIRGIKVSAHFLIRRHGEVTQFVSCDDRAWHAGTSTWLGQDDCNNYSVGIELEGLEGQGFEVAQYEALSTLLRAAQQQFPLRHVVGHEHIAPGRKIDPGAGFDWALLRSLLNWPPAMFGALNVELHVALDDALDTTPERRGV
jgi:N-acetyl-anhydromuramoyl-L-alanine amidase